MVEFNNLSEMLCSDGYNIYLESKLGNDLFINDAERAERIAEYAENGGCGSFHSEVIEDMREYLDTFTIYDIDDESGDITQELYALISKEIDETENWHEKNGSLFEIIN